jgi:hypothetical protein
MKSNPILLAVCCAVLGLAAGCAAPGAPQPPSLRLPQAVDNLSAVRKGNRVVLTWSPPTVTTDHQPMRWPTTTRICRVVNQFPINQCGEPIAQIKSSDLASAIPTARRPVVSFEDVVPPALLAAQNQATYAIEAVNQRGRSAGISNQVRTSLVPTLSPPAAFRVTLDAQGPLLQWNIDSGLAPSPDVSYLIRVYRRASAAEGQSSSTGSSHAQGKPEFTLVGEQPYRIGSGEARDNSFEWEQEYDYKADVVTVIAAPDRPVIEVEGDDTGLAHLVAHDVFPPAIPSGLQAVFSSVGQKPFIDLTWAPDTERDLAGYIVYRRTGDASAFAVVSSAPVKAPAWRDNDVHPGQKYSYTVTAIDVRGNESAQSAPAVESVPLEVR